MDQYIGKMLDNRYEILEVIGTGGMAVVYKARCHRLNRLVAIKILRDDLAQDAEFRRRFHDESQAVAMLSHPNIMAVYDVSRSSEVEYIVMELIDGITLKQYMQKKGTPLNWREALHFITQIMKALSHAHSRGIIHRDIKPQNIMVLRDGSVKVTDFGIARLASAAQNTLTQEALGSVHYISPEQARGSRIDSRSDLYSAGVVLYEMLTGQLPFEGDTPVSVAIQHINSIPLAPRELNPDIPEALEAITMKAMAPNVDQRYASADAMLSDLEEFRKNPSINFDYTPADLFTPPDGGDEPTQVIDTGRRKAVHNTPPERRDSGDDYEEEEDRRGMARKRRKHDSGLSVPVALAAILIFVVGIGVFLWMTFFSDIFVAPPADHPVPYLVGQALSDVLADTAITDEFEIKEGATVPSSTQPAGTIVSQSPEGGKTAKGERPTITVDVSGGSETVPMPDVTNKEYREAILALGKLGLEVTSTTQETSDSVTANYVIRTDPLPGVTVTPGQSITLVISQGPEIKKVTVLSLIDQPLEEAKKIIAEDLHLTLGSVTEVESDKPAGTVVSQTIPAATEVDEGSTIALQVSKGPAEGDTEPSPSPEVTPSLPPDTTPAPETTPEVTPIVPSAPVVSTTTSKTFTVAIPQDTRDTIQVRIEVGGAVPFDNPVQASLIKSISPVISGSGKQTVSVYFDDVFAYSQEVDFSK